MAFGMKTTSGDFLPIIKYDARAGKLFRVDKRIDGGSDVVELPPGTKFAIDFGSLEAGYVSFGLQGPVRHMIPYIDGQPMPPQPQEKDAEGKLMFRPGFYVKVAGRAMDGIREWCSNAAVLLNALDDLWNTFKAAPEAAAGQIPIICIASTVAVKSGTGARSSTNYAPVFRIEGWTERLSDFAARTVPPPVRGATQAAQAAPVSPPPPPPVVAPTAGAAVTGGSLSEEIPF